MTVVVMAVTATIAMEAAVPSFSDSRKSFVAKGMEGDEGSEGDHSYEGGNGDGGGGDSNHRYGGGWS